MTYVDGGPLRYKFSECNQEEIRYVLNMRGKTCWNINALTFYSVKDVYPGALLSPTDFCRRFYKNNDVYSPMGGFDSATKQYKVHFPSNFGYGFAFTVVFEYTGQYKDTSSLTLAHQTKPTETYLTLGFSDAYSLEYYRDTRRQYVRLERITTPPKGFHVLEFHTEASRLTVTLDGNMLFPSSSVYAETDEMRIFYTGPTGGSKFVFWESHFTAIEFFVQFEPIFAFRHENLSIGNGGYAFIRAKWPRDIDIKVSIRLGNTSLMKTIRSVGETVFLIKMYSTGFAIGYANKNTGAIVDQSLTNIPLDGFHVEPLPNQVIEFTVVTGDSP
ncbi:uncharacterized protein LOC119402071 [Rhipicephalus sanguineus]|uniref:uncharacterized protein LOC119402071 n=1 Tax=Rhipicephalus sanguineus TaxID=34632 RepID=UPI0018930E36|nr:uncharacterized protein LOC119402071 [Rhipicephalus sanguineus]